MSDKITVPTAATDERPWYLASERTKETRFEHGHEVVLVDSRWPARGLTSRVSVSLPDKDDCRRLALRIATLLNDEEESHDQNPR